MVNSSSLQKIYRYPLNARLSKVRDSTSECANKVPSNDFNSEVANYVVGIWRDHSERFRGKFGTDKAEVFSQQFAFKGTEGKSNNLILISRNSSKLHASGLQLKYHI